MTHHYSRQSRLSVKPLPLIKIIVSLCAISTLMGGCVTRYRAEAIENNILVLEDKVKSLQEELDESSKLHEATLEGIHQTYKLLEKRLSELQRSSASDQTIVQDLRKTITQLEDHIERLNFELNRQKQQNQQAAEPVAELPEDQEKLYQEAEQRLLAQEYQAAIRLYTAFIERYPSDARVDDSLYQVAVSHYHLKQYDACIKVITQIVKEYPKDGKAEKSLILLYDAQRAQGECDRARGALEFLLKNYPRSKQVRIAKRKLEQRC